MLEGKKRKPSYERAAEILTRVGLGHRINHRPDELSGGEQQRSRSRRALVFDPGLVLADEPTGNLDSKSGVQIMEMISSLSARFQKNRGDGHARSELLELQRTTDSHRRRPNLFIEENRRA